jgi:antitoxin (DNA-binding transcriptional repressor) of toxin-antitoxin stability system
MRTISQRELRNDSAEIMRGLQRGESYQLTSRGRVVGRVVPDTGTPIDDLIVRPRRRDMDFADLKGVEIHERTEDVLRELRGDR